MDAESRLARVGVFVGVVVGVALLVGIVAALGGSAPPDTDADPSTGYPNTTELVPEQAEATDGTVGEAPVGDEPRVVLVDNSHANRFVEDDLQPLFDALSPRHEVVFTSDTSAGFEASLSEADAYVVIDPAIRHSEEEADAVQSFAEDGGRVVLLGEPTRVSIAQGPLGGSLIDVRSALNRLSARLGVVFGTDYLYDEVNNEGNYKRVLADGRGALDGDRAALYTATTVEAPGGERLLVTPETTRLSAQSEARGHAVAVRTDHVLAVGDSTFLTGGKSVVADNERLVRTIAGFAVGGDRSRDVADFPHFLADEPRIRYSSAELLDATKGVASEVRASGRSASVAPTGRSVAPRRTDVLVTTFDDLESSNAPETGIEVTAASVSVPGYEGTRDGVAIVHRPEGPIDLVIAASSPERAAAVVDLLGEGGLRGDLLSDRTAVTVAESGTDPGPDEPPDGTPPGDEPSSPSFAPPGTVRG